MDKDQYTFIKASFDGGVALECWRNYDRGEAEIMMKAVWHDESKEFGVQATAAQLPFDLWESFIAEARRWCPLRP